MAKSNKNKTVVQQPRAPKSDAKPIKVMAASALLLAIFSIFFGLKIENKTIYQRLTSPSTATTQPVK